MNADQLAAIRDAGDKARVLADMRGHLLHETRQELAAAQRAGRELQAEVERLAALNRAAADALTIQACRAVRAEGERDRLTAAADGLRAATTRADTHGVYVMSTSLIRQHLTATDGRETP